MLPYLKNILLLIILTLFVLGGVIIAGVDAPTPTPEPTFYTLTDIYNLIHSISTTTPGSHDLYPSVSTSATSSYSISELYADLANLIPQGHIETGYTYLGVVGDYDNTDPNPYNPDIIYSSLTPAGTPGDSYGYSLEDIYNLIVNNATTTSGAHSSSPSTAPASTMHSLTDIYNELLTLATTMAPHIKSGEMYLGVEGVADVILPISLSYVSQIGSLGSGDNEFSSPTAITTDGTYLYILDIDNDRLVKRNIDLSYVSQIGSEGSGDNEFYNPYDIITDGNYLYVLDSYNDRLVKRNLDLSYVSQIGSRGSGDNEFYDPEGITTDGTFLYVLDTGNDRLVKRNIDLSYVSQIGSLGSGDNEFDDPYGIIADGAYLYITDTGNHRLVKRNIDLSYVSQIGSEGSGNDEFYYPIGITKYGTFLYISDSGNNRIVKRNE